MQLSMSIVQVFLHTINKIIYVLIVQHFVVYIFICMYSLLDLVSFIIPYHPKKTHRSLVNLYFVQQAFLPALYACWAVNGISYIIFNKKLQKR